MSNSDRVTLSSARVGMVVTLILGFIAGYHMHSPSETEFIQSEDYDPEVGEIVCERVYGKEGDPHIEYGALLIEEWVADDRELVLPEHEITTVVSVFHIFDSYEELQHINLVDGWGTGEVWGWSDCERVETHNYAACDIFTVRPEYVLGDPAFDTIGHEVGHGIWGDFHE